MKFKVLFEKYNKWSEPILIAFSLVTLVYVFLHAGTVELHSLLTVISVLIVSLITSVHLLFHNLRKKFAAGIVGFQQEHTPFHAVERLRGLKSDYLYIGRSFESMLDAFEKARLKGGMAHKTEVRLLLTNVADPIQLRYCLEIEPGNWTEKEFQKALSQKLLKTLAALDGFGKLTIRLHTAPFKGWVHLFDHEAMLFGMMPRGIDGLQAPAIELEPVPRRWSLFDHLNDWAEDAWNKAEKVEDLNQWKAKLTALAN